MPLLLETTSIHSDLDISSAFTRSGFSLKWLMAEQWFPYAAGIVILSWAAVLLSDNPIAVFVLTRKKHPIFPASLRIVVRWTAGARALSLHDAGVIFPRSVKRSDS